MGNFDRDRFRGRSSFGGGGRNFGRGRDRGADRPMYKATCSNCGKECEVPFRPTSGKPVYCSECFEKMGGRRADSGRVDRPDFRAPAPNFDQNKNQFDAINSKLDRILNLLEPKALTPVIPAPVMEEVKEEKVPKSKKAAKKPTSIKGK